MNLQFQVIKRVEIPKITTKIKYLLSNHLSHFLLITIGLLLMYVVYGVFSMQAIINMDFNLGSIFINVVKLSLILSGFFIIIMRDSFKSDHLLFFYINSNITASQLLFSRLFLPFVFYLWILVFMGLPVLISLIIQGYHVPIFVLFLLLVIISISYFLVFTIWMLVNLLNIKLFGVRERFWLNSILLALLIVVLFLLTNPIEKLIEKKHFIQLSFILSLGTCVLFLYRKLSLTYLTKIFMQKDAGTLSQTYKSKNFAFKNKFLLQSRLESIHFFRHQVLKEQGLFFVILIIMVAALYHTMTLMTFSILYSMIINFGIKEIILLLPLYIGIHYREYNQAIYMLNVEKYTYYLTRLLIVYLVNCIIYFSFFTISYFITGIPFTDIVPTLIVIAFITMLSTFVGFVLKINELNKIYVIIVLLVTVYIFDFLINQLFQSQIYIYFVYLSLTVLLFYLVESLYLRRPILR